VDGSPTECCDVCDIFVNCNWVAARWQQYSTHLHTHNTQNDKKQTIHGTTQQFGRVWTVPHLCGFYPNICLTTEEKARKPLSLGCRRMPAGTMKIHKHTIGIHRHKNENILITILSTNTTIYTLIKKIEPKEYIISN